MSRVRTWTVGRHRGCDLVLEDRSVSRRHAEVVFLPDGRIHLTDRASTNGTFVLEGNRWRPLQQAILRPVDRIRLGQYPMTAGELGAWCRRSDGKAEDGSHGRDRPSVRPPD